MIYLNSFALFLLKNPNLYKYEGWSNNMSKLDAFAKKKEEISSEIQPRSRGYTLFPILIELP